MTKHKWTDEEIKEYLKTHRGILYINRMDTRLFVPKTVGIGFTMNFANPLSWIISILLVTAIIWGKNLF